MLDGSCGAGMRQFARVILFFCLMSCTIPALSAADQKPNQALYNIVGVGRGRGEILLATLAKPADLSRWHFRNIPVSPLGTTVRDVVLSTTGTKALVVFADGTARVVDLTERITGISASEVSAPQHRLTTQLFPYAWKNKVCLLDDLGHPEPGQCRRAMAAAVNEDGRVLYALDDGRLVIGGPDQRTKELPYRLPAGAQFQLLAGHRGDARDFLVLVTDFVRQPGPAKSGRITEIIDPRLPATPLGQFHDSTVAALRAELEFTNAVPTTPVTSRVKNPSETTIATLVPHLEAQTLPAHFEWSFYRVAVDPELYAPVLEFAPGESAFPSDVGIWQQIRPLAHGDSRQAYEAAYASLGDERWSGCTSYIRTLSFPGTWLLEYWFYYPFDEGKTHPHIHDSEHIFVEVDKLGGAVRNILASDHDSLVPNAIYSTLVKNSHPVALPLFAMVELGKHAMAPDLDHDGQFVRGLDDNLHRESYSFWGIRDRGSKFHFVMEPYRASMSMPRSRQDRFALKNDANLFPGIDVPTNHQVCSLQAFPDDPPCPSCNTASPEGAAAYLADNIDARAPQNIYKPYVLPWREVRFGVGLYDWREGREQLSVTYVGDFRHMTGGLLPIPARLGLEYIWSPRDINVPVSVGGQQQYTQSTSTMWAGVQIERPVTNTQGFYFGVTPEWSRISTRAVGGALSPAGPHWQYTGVSYHLGYMIELPSAHKGNFTNQIGIVVRDAPDYPVLFEWRISFGFFRQRGRHDFGARRGDRNPYQ